MRHLIYSLIKLSENIMNTELVKFIKVHMESLDAVLDLIPVPVFTKDVQGRYLACNAAFERFMRTSRAKIVGKTVYELWPKTLADIYSEKDKELYDNPGLQVYETDQIILGRESTVQFHKATFSDIDGKIAGLLGVIFDRTTEKALENKLIQLAHIDTLTGLLNRYAGFDAMKRLFAESTRNKNVFSIAMMDIDHFKNINDKYGHDAGDRVLESIQNISKGVLREYDFIFRYGGEEFVLCFPNTTIEEAYVITERLRVRFERYKFNISRDETVQVTVSIGVASYPEHGKSIETLIKVCDKSLYLAKHCGRNNIKRAS